MEVGGCRGRACEGQGRGGERAFTGEGGLRACVEGGEGRGADHRIWLGDVRGHSALWLSGGMLRNSGRQAGRQERRQAGVSLADAPNRAARTPHQSVRHNTASTLLPLPPLLPLLYTQVDASPDRPAPGEIREREAPTPGGKGGAGGTPIDGMIIGANVNSYLRRGAEFDVMRNVEAGVEDAGVWRG